ncbi:hypothetical protein BJF78_15870 [Pseudonocardia sp. CNS-139]|nr:hypothetical protein BJF78_15870 [Pseudonocardia sp. CNS-139]
MNPAACPGRSPAPMRHAGTNDASGTRRISTTSGSGGPLRHRSSIGSTSNRCMSPHDHSAAVGERDRDLLQPALRERSEPRAQPQFVEQLQRRRVHRVDPVGK